MTPSATGSDLVGLAEGAHGNLVIIAPYIQANALSYILQSAARSLSVTVLTQWSPQDLASGASDPHIWGALKERQGARLLLKGNLHAKFYRADDACLIGSANVTSRGLGWSANANAEILWRLTPVPDELHSLETAWISNAMEVDDELHNWAAGLYGQPVSEDTKPPEGAGQINGFWWPRLRHPADLWAVYSGQELPPSTVNAAWSDLSALRIPLGLDESEFFRSVAVSVLQTPARAWVDARLTTPQRFGAMRDALAARLATAVDERDATEAWQTMARWLLHFLPGRYEYFRPRHSEVLSLKNGGT